MNGTHHGCFFLLHTDAGKRWGLHHSASLTFILGLLWNSRSHGGDCNLIPLPIHLILIFPAIHSRDFLFFLQQFKHTVCILDYCFFLHREALAVFNQLHPLNIYVRYISATCRINDMRDRVVRRLEIHIM